MPKSTPTESDLAETLERVTDLAESALDPELSREDLVRLVKNIADLASDATEAAEDQN
jgi:hypothetical protein